MPSAIAAQVRWIGQPSGTVNSTMTVMNRSPSAANRVPSPSTSRIGNMISPQPDRNAITVGAGAKILGRIHIGDDVVIGANAVVITDVPSNSIAVGVPARILPGRPAAPPVPNRDSAPATLAEIELAGASELYAEAAVTGGK